LTVVKRSNSIQVMAEIDLRRVDEREIDTILADDIQFTGVLTFHEPLMIKGYFRGEIQSTSDLYIGEKALVEAKIHANRVSNHGHIKGNVTARSKIELFSASRIDGDMTAPIIEMESGAKFNGICSMPEVVT
jgi:cytoskeletal protein CcmA (bactofilin family)